MARKKTTSVTSRPRKQSVGLFDQFKLGESYTSLILGIIVVVIASLILMTFVKNRNAGKQTSQEISSQKIEEVSKTIPTTYTVAAGDNLWSISEKIYKSGYNWVDIANANKLSAPDTIEAGTKLVIPKVEKKATTATLASNVEVPSSIKESSYVVNSGDDLWSIAVRAYGDGYAWVKIAKANNLSNPDIIHSGNTLTISR